MIVRLKLLNVMLFFMCLATAGCLSPANTKPVAMPPPPIAPVYEKGIVKASARIREAPSKQAKVLNTVPAGTEVKIIQTLDNWYKISTYDGREGYIYHTLLRIIPGSKANAALSPVHTPPGRLDPPKTYFVIRDARLRSGPGTEYDPPLASVKAGATFTADGFSGSWYHGTVQNKTGWLSSSLLDNKLPNKKSQGPAPQKDDSISSTVQQRDTEAAPAEQPPPKQESTVKQANANSQPPQAQGTVPAGKARISSLSPVKLRSHPSQFGKVVEELAPGTEVTVLENQGNWCKIKTVNNEGFVTSENLSLGGK